MIKHIVWDWNGTLLDDVAFCVKCMNSLLEKRSLPLLNIERYSEIFRFPVSDYYKELGFDFEKEPFESLSIQFMDLYLKGISSCPLRKGARDVLKKFQTLRIGNTILTASKQSLIDEQVPIYQLENEFDSWHGIDNYHAAGKVGIGLKLIDSLPYDGEELLFVGDTLHDAEVAKEMNIPSVLIYSGHQSKARLRSNGNRVIDKLEEILEII